jgi:hypothetical protein
VKNCTQVVGLSWLFEAIIPFVQLYFSQVDQNPGQLSIPDVSPGASLKTRLSGKIQDF